MDHPIVDVIIPTYNRAYCVARAIDSVLGQTHPRCRAIVVDDGSTDDTMEMMAARYGGDARVVYIRQANGGVAHARNTGLAAASGDYVAFLDSDDRWKPWKVALQLDCLRALPGVGMVWTDMDAVDASDAVLKERYLRTMYGAYRHTSTQRIFAASRPLAEVSNAGVERGARLYWGDIFSPMILGNLVHTSTVLLSRERARRVGGFNEALKYSGEDYDFHLRTCREGPVAFADVAAIDYRVGSEDQLTQPAYHVHIARNYLNTILPVLASDRARIRLPAWRIRAVVAKAHAWISDELFHAQDIAGARRHAWQSVRANPLQGRIWAILLAACLPPAVLAVLLSSYRAVKHAMADMPPFDMFF